MKALFSLILLTLSVSAFNQSHFIYDLCLADTNSQINSIKDLDNHYDMMATVWIYPDGKISVVKWDIDEHFTYETILENSKIKESNPAVKNKYWVGGMYMKNTIWPENHYSVYVSNGGNVTAYLLSVDETKKMYTVYYNSSISHEPLALE